MSKRHASTMLAISIGTVLASAQAYAAPQQASNEGIDEVIVTARQRAESIKDVPASVQAFTSADIAAAGIERPQDFIALTPGVSQVQTAEVGDMQVNIRGINTNRDAETNFALVIDGVLQTNPNAFNRELSNVSQIEVLKGPQSALYGRNALAGAIILTTRKPTEEFGVDVNVGTANKGTHKGSIYLQGGLSEGVTGSISAYMRETNGFFTNSLLDCNDCSDYAEESGMNARVLVNVGESGTLDFKAGFSNVDSGAINFNAAFALPAFAAFLNNPDFYQDVNDHQFVYLNNIKPINEQSNRNISVKGEFDVGLGTLTGTLAYNKQTNYFLTDGTSAAFGVYAAEAGCQQSLINEPGGPLPSPFFYAGGASLLPPYSPTTCDGYQYQQRDYKDVSAEIRLTSPGDQQLRWQAGLYYGDIDRRVVVSQGADLGRGFETEPYVPPSGANPTDLLYDDSFKTKIAAVFGNVAYDIADNIELALALRYDREKRDGETNVPRVLAPFLQPSACAPNCFINPAYNVPGAGTTIPGRSKTFTQLQPKLSVNWKVTEDFSVFASYGVGFRSGGFNSLGSQATIATYYAGLNFVNAAGNVTSTPAVADVNDDFKKETSKAAEVGFKATLFDRHLSINGAVFYTKLKDAQFFNFFAGPFGLLRVVSNIDKETIKGAEFDARWKINDMFSFFGGVGFVDGKINEYAGRPYTVGNEIPFAPKYTANLGGEMALPVGSSGVEFVTRVDVSALGETWFHPVQEESVQTLFGAPSLFSKTKRDAFALLNARVSLRGENWDLTAWGRNLADKQYLAEVIPAPEFGGSFIHSGTGRAFGVDVTYKFR